MRSRDGFGTRRILRVGGQEFGLFSLPALAERTRADVALLAACLKVLLENLLRHEDGDSVTAAAIAGLAGAAGQPWREMEVGFRQVRVLTPDSSGIPLLVDLVVMRDAVVARGLDPRLVNPRIPVDLVIDHSVQVDHSGTPEIVSAERPSSPAIARTPRPPRSRTSRSSTDQTPPAYVVALPSYHPRP